MIFIVKGYTVWPFSVNKKSVVIVKKRKERKVKTYFKYPNSLPPSRAPMQFLAQF